MPIVEWIIKALSHAKDVTLKEKIYILEGTNAQLDNVGAHLRVSIYEIREEDAPLQSDNNILFDKYCILKKYSILSCCI